MSGAYYPYDLDEFADVTPRARVAGVLSREARDWLNSMCECIELSKYGEETQDDRADE